MVILPPPPPPALPPAIFLRPSSGCDEMSGWEFLGALGLGVGGAALFILVLHLIDRRNRRRQAS